MIYALVEDFFAAATFKGLLEKFVVYFGLYESPLHFLEREEQIDTTYGKKI